MSKDLNNPSISVALGYDKAQDVAPKIMAKGKDYMAKQLVAIAQQHQIAIHQDESLAKMLGQLDVGEIIPIEAYIVVAEILSYLYSTGAGVKE